MSRSDDPAAQQLIELFNWLTAYSALSRPATIKCECHWCWPVRSLTTKSACVTCLAMSGIWFSYMLILVSVEYGCFPSCTRVFKTAALIILLSNMDVNFDFDTWLLYYQCFWSPDPTWHSDVVGLLSVCHQFFQCWPCPVYSTNRSGSTSEWLLINTEKVLYKHSITLHSDLGTMITVEILNDNCY